MRKPILIDALGGISNVNLRLQTGAQNSLRERQDKDVDARALSDLTTSGLSAANITLGYVAGDMEPFEHNVREIGDIFLERKAGRTSVKDVTIYKSLGIAAQDIVVAQFIANESKRLGLGQELSV